MTTPNPNLSELRRLAEGARAARAKYQAGGSYDQDTLVPHIAWQDELSTAIGYPEETILALLDMVENAPARDTET